MPSGGRRDDSGARRNLSMPTEPTVRMLTKSVSPERATSPTPAPGWLKVWNIASSAWCSEWLCAWALIVAALIFGSQLRLSQLARWDMSGDEGASWAAASASNTQAVVETEQRLDPGKLALYDIILHEWIGVFGESLFAMRIMSVGLGIVSLMLVFIAVREVCGALGGTSSAFGTTAGAFAAFIYATNLTMIQSDRTVRMYPLLMATELLQITFFCRAQRRGSLANYAGVAIFTAAMAAANFTSGFLIFAEVIWLQCLLFAKDTGSRGGGLTAFGTTLAMIAGIALLTPMLPSAFSSSASAVRIGYINWIKLQPISWPYTTLRDGIGGSALFWTFMILGALGLWQQWRSGPLASAFFALCTIGSILTAMALSYLIHPVENMRYVLIAFVGIFGFAAIGAASVRSTLLRLILVLMILRLTIHPAHRWLRHSHEAAWREATEAALDLSSGTTISVVPSYAVNVVRYYLPHDARNMAAGVESGCGSGRVLILSGFSYLPIDLSTRMTNCYPRLVKSLNQVQVRSR